MPIVLNGSTGVISASSLSGISTGKILQTKQVVKTDTFSLAASSTNQRIDITGLTIDITPSSASNTVSYTHLTLPTT